MKLNAQKCQCGAVTISNKSFSNSMRPSVFKAVFAAKHRFSWLSAVCCCDHCVNHWGIDLCGCGSGDKVGKCTGGFVECETGKAAQEPMQQKELICKF